MRYSSSADSLALKRSSIGPAAMALRSARMRGRAPPGPLSLTHGGSFGNVGSVAAPYYHGVALPYYAGLGDTAAKQAVATASGAAAKVGGVSLASAAGAGAWAGPIGMAAGLIVGLVIGKILNKQYLNVPQANAIADASVQAFQQYKQIAGQLPGRQLGVDAMNAIWNGAIYSGYFPGNNQQLCFHEGCLKYRGQPAWVWGTFHNGANNPYTFAAAWAKMRTQAPAPAIYAPGTALVQPVTPGAVGTAIVRPQIAGSFRSMLMGLGSLGDIAAGVPDAVTLIDNYFIPASRSDNPPWAIPQNPLEHQILYDAADAWLAVNGDANSTPFVAVANTQPANTPGTITAADPTQGGTPPVGPGPGGSGVTVGAGPIGTGANTYSLVPVTNPQTGQTTYQIQPGTRGAGTALTTATAGLSNIPTWGYLLVAAGIIFAIARPEMSPAAIAHSRRKRP